MTFRAEADKLFADFARAWQRQDDEQMALIQASLRVIGACTPYLPRPVRRDEAQFDYETEAEACGVTVGELLR